MRLSYTLIYKGAVWAFYGEFFESIPLYFPYNLGFNAKASGNGQQIFRYGWIYIDFKPMAAIKDLVHFLPACARLFLY